MDVITVTLVSFVSYYWRQNWPFNLFLKPIQPLEFYLRILPLLIIIFLIFFYLTRLYTKEALAFDLFYRASFIRAMFFWGISIAILIYIIRYGYSRVVFCLLWSLVFIFLYFIRWQFAELLLLKKNQAFRVLSSENKGRILAKELALNFLANKALKEKGAPVNNFFIYSFLKRLIDISLGFILLLATLPFWPIILILIRLESPGNEIFRQKRVGLYGRIFYMYKFKTMTGEPKDAPAPTDCDDSRITRVGKFLRKYSLDELPQIINILRGEMSLVGPRPEMPFVVKKYQKWQKARLEVKPGLTGLWQILGRKNLPLKENLEYDFYYLNNQSLFLDLAIILKTIPTVLSGSGAY